MAAIQPQGWQTELFNLVGVSNHNGTLDVNASDSSDMIYLGNPALGDIQTSGSSSVSRE
ncbi:MAG: hypothetical protein BMS9Abin02_1546 [Anaerolineae bacterium]|nr:MAG: hypothetical protein BMS9Abin02_1546 [Anaerolineae bacterium]